MTVPDGSLLVLDADLSASQRVAWSDSRCQVSHCELVVTADLSLRATITDGYRLFVDGAGFERAAFVRLNRQTRSLPIDDWLPANTNVALESTAPAGLTRTSISSPCDTLSDDCRFTLDADTHILITVSRLVEWATLTTTSPADGYEVTDLLERDGGVIVAGRTTGSVWLGARNVSTPPGEARLFLAEFRSNRTFDAVSTEDSSSPDLVHPALWLHNTDFGPFATITYSNRQSGVGLPRLSWGAVRDAGSMTDEVGFQFTMLELQPMTLAPSRAALTGWTWHPPLLQFGSYSELLIEQLMKEEGRLRLPIALAGYGTEGGQPGFADGGLWAGTQVFEPDFSTATLRALATMDGLFLDRSTSADGRFLLSRSPAFASPLRSPPTPPGCSGFETALVQMSFLNGAACSVNHVVSDGGSLPLQFIELADGVVIAELEENNGVFSTLKLTMLTRALEPSWTVRLPWSRAAATPPNQPIMFGWGPDVLVAAPVQWTGRTRQAVHQADGGELHCRGPATTNLGSYFDLHLLIFDGSSGTLRWADCIPAIEAEDSEPLLTNGVTASARFDRGLLFAQPSGDALVRSHLAVGDLLLDTTVVGSAQARTLVYITPPTR